MSQELLPPPISAESCQELAEQMNQKYANYLKNRHFSISSRLEDDVVYATVTLSNLDQSYYYPVEMRIVFAEEELSAEAAGLFLIDYCDAYFEEYLAEDHEELYLPIDWSPRQYDAVDFQIRGQIINLKLERMADALLAGL